MDYTLVIRDLLRLTPLLPWVIPTVTQVVRGPLATTEARMQYLFVVCSNPADVLWSSESNLCVDFSTYSLQPSNSYHMYYTKYVTYFV